MAVKKAKAKKKVARRKQVVLPRKLSSLVKIALRDIRKAEKVPTYLIDMGTYHEPDEVVCKLEGIDRTVSTQKVCVVCAAGSVMAFSLGAKPEDEMLPYHFEKNAEQLKAIDFLRTASITDAVHELDIWNGTLEPVYNKLEQFDVPEYDRSNPEPFHKAMTKLHTALVKAKL